MADQVLEVVSVASAAGWWTDDDNRPNDYLPLACWAVVVMFDPEFAGAGSRREVIGLTVDDLNIVGKEWPIKLYYHETQFDVVGRELK